MSGQLCAVRMIYYSFRTSWKGAYQFQENTLMKEITFHFYSHQVCEKAHDDDLSVSPTQLIVKLKMDAKKRLEINETGSRAARISEKAPVSSFRQLLDCL